MKAGRKNLKRGTEEHNLSLQDGQRIMQVVSLRGSNVIEVRDVQGEKSLALFPAKFQKSVWIKRGSFVVVDVSGREKAVESGSKVEGMVSQALFYDQIRALRKSSEWSEFFKSTSFDESSGSLARDALEENSELKSSDGDDDDDDDGLPPLEANRNRIKPFGYQLDGSTSDSSGSDTDI